MVKKGKRKNPGVGIDFKRAKYKVGRKLAPAQNATDTTIKSATISMAQQSMAVDRTGHALTERKLTLKETLSQVGHYSERVRRDALEGLAQLATSEPAVVRRAAGQIMDVTVSRLSDADAGVRETLLTALRTALLPALGARALEPFLPRLMAGLSAVLTSLAAPVRADALRALGVVAQTSSAALGPTHLPGLLRHFVTLLSRASRGRSLAAGSLASLEQTLAALETLLSRAAAARGEREEASGREDDQVTGVTSTLSMLRFGSPLPLGGAELLELGWPDLAPTEGPRDAAPRQAAGEGEARELCARLVDAWTECGVESLATEPSELSARCGMLICRCLSLLMELYGGLDLLIGQEKKPRSNDTLQRLMTRVVPAFPPATPVGSSSPALLEALAGLGSAGISLLLKLLPLGLDCERQGGPRGNPGKAKVQLAPWVDTLLAWVKRVLYTDSVLATDGVQGSKASHKAGAAKQLRLPAAVYLSAVRDVAVPLPLLPGVWRNDLATAVGSLARRAEEQSAVFGAICAFWEPLLADPVASFRTPLPDGKPLIGANVAVDWIKKIPRTLWKLGHARPELSIRLLRSVQTMVRLEPDGAQGPLAAALVELQAQSLVLWGVPAPKPAGVETAQSKRFLKGPLAALPAEAQELAANTVAYMSGPLPPTLLPLAAWVAFEAAFPTASALRLIRSLPVAPETLPSRAGLAKLLETLLVGPEPSRTPTPADQARRAAIADAACGLLEAQPDALPLLHELLLPVLIARATPAGACAALTATLRLQRRLAAGHAGAELGAVVLTPDIVGAHLGEGADEAQLEALVRLTLELADCAPSLLPALLPRLAAPGGAHTPAPALAKAIVARLRLLLALLQRASLAAGLLKRQQDVLSALANLGGATERLHAADADAGVAAHVLTQCRARADILFGTLSS